MTTTTLTTIKNQKKTFGPKQYRENGITYRITAVVRHDDECGNGRNSFSITGTIDRQGKAGRWHDDAAGCIHKEIAKHFPELAPLIKWHLCATDGPLHYFDNTTYNAGNIDHYGLAEGEADPRSLENFVTFGENPIRHRYPQRGFMEFLQEHAPQFDFEIIRFDHDKDRETYGPRFHFGGYGDAWHNCPFKTQEEAERFLYALQNCKPKFISVPTSFGKGKARDFDAARSCAVWPEATDAQLSLPKDELTKLLKARLPKLLKEFRSAVESLGMTF